MRKLAARWTKLNCCYNPRALVAEFTYTFAYEVSTSTPTPTATATPIAAPYFDIETFSDVETSVNTEAAIHSAAAPVTWGAQPASPHVSAACRNGKMEIIRQLIVFKMLPAGPPATTG